jgi:ParB family chromosome partitioning protein
VKHALFPLEAYAGEVVADLFGEDSYFADTDQFWRLQNEWLSVRIEAWLADGWAGVDVLDVGRAFYDWQHERVGRAEGGRIFVEVSPKGEVTFHEGYLDKKAAQRLRNAAERAAAGEDGKAARSAARSELTSAQQTYIDLHRLAAARLALADAPAVALRLLLAHAVGGAAHWRVETEGRHGVNPALAESLAANAATAAYGERRAAAARRLGLDPEARELVGRRPDGGASGLFARLLSMGDDEVLQVAAVVMAESLAAGSAEVEAAGAWLKVEMAEVWSPDEAFFDLIRDRETVNAMLKEVGGRKVADGNLTEKVKTQKAIIQDFLAGTNDRPKVEAWTPRWMAVPAAAYTRRPCAPAARARSVAPLLKRVRPPQPNPVAIAAE